MKLKITIIIFFVLISICITFISLKKLDPKNSNRIIANAVVTNVYPAKISKHGFKPAKYDIYFLDKNGIKQQVFRVELGTDYQKNDTTQISYNPENMNDVKSATSNN